MEPKKKIEITIFTEEDRKRGIVNYERKLEELEREWRRSIRVSDAELIKIFPEAKKVIPTKIREWTTERKAVTDIIREKLTVIKEKPAPSNQWFWIMWVKFNEGKELLKIDKQIARLKRLLLVSKGRVPKKGVTQEMIQRAENTQIESIVNVELQKSGKALVGLCPIHSEKTPSFYIYPETNSWYCYGCNRGGNVINLIMFLHGLNFPDTVRWLLKNHE